MKNWMCALLAALLLLSVRAGAETIYELAEAIDFEAVQQQLEKGQATVRVKDVFDKLLSGEMEFDAQAIGKIVLDQAKESLGAVSAGILKTAFAVMLGALVKALLGEEKAGKSASSAVNFACLAAMCGLMKSGVDACGEALRVLVGMSDALSPVLMALLALTGGTRTAALITPLGAFVSNIISKALATGALSLVCALSALYAGDAMGGIKLKRLTELAGAFVKWLIGASLGAVLMLVSTGGLVAGAYDGALLKGARYFSGSVIPIVGSDIAGKMEALAASAQLVRSAAGVSVMIALAAVVLKPLLSHVLTSWLLKALAAVAEPVAGEDTVRLLDGFAKVFGMLAALVAASGAMLLVLIGATIGMGMRISA